MADIQVKIYDAALRALAQDAMMQPLMKQAGDAVAATAASLAPKDTGELADSIHAEVERDAEGWHADVSWGPDYFYGLFWEVGTSRNEPRPFLRPALDSTRI